MVNAPFEAVLFRVVTSLEPPLRALSSLVEHPEDLDELIALEAETNEVAAEALGHIRRVPLADRYRGPDATLIMLSFVLPRPSRFSDGSYGVWYGGLDLETAIAETRYHRARFLAAVAEPPGYLAQFAISASLTGNAHAATALPAPMDARIHDPDDYSAAQSYGRRVRDDGADAIIYRSVRLEGGTCVGALRPRVLRAPRREAALRYEWDGTRIAHVYRLIV